MLELTRLRCPGALAGCAAFFSPPPAQPFFCFSLTLSPSRFSFMVTCGKVEQQENRRPGGVTWLRLEVLHVHTQCYSKTVEPPGFLPQVGVSHQGTNVRARSAHRLLVCTSHQRQECSVLQARGKWHSTCCYACCSRKMLSCNMESIGQVVQHILHIPSSAAHTTASMNLFGLVLLQNTLVEVGCGAIFMFDAELIAPGLPGDKFFFRVSPSLWGGHLHHWLGIFLLCCPPCGLVFKGRTRRPDYFSMHFCALSATFLFFITDPSMIPYTLFAT